MDLQPIAQAVVNTGYRFELVFDEGTWHAILKERRFNEGMYFGASEISAEDAIRGLLRVEGTSCG